MSLYNELSTRREFHYKPNEKRLFPLSGGYLHPHGFVIGTDGIGPSKQSLFPVPTLAFLGDFSPSVPDMFRIFGFNGFDIVGQFSYRQDKIKSTLQKFEQFLGRGEQTAIIGRLSVPALTVQWEDSHTVRLTERRSSLRRRISISPDSEIKPETIDCSPPMIRFSHREKVCELSVDSQQLPILKNGFIRDNAWEIIGNISPFQTWLFDLYFTPLHTLSSKIRPSKITLQRVESRPFFAIANPFLHRAMNELEHTIREIIPFRSEFLSPEERRIIDKILTETCHCSPIFSIYKDYKEKEPSGDSILEANDPRQSVHIADLSRFFLDGVTDSSDLISLVEEIISVKGWRQLSLRESGWLLWAMARVNHPLTDTLVHYLLNSIIFRQNLKPNFSPTADRLSDTIILWNGLVHYFLGYSENNLGWELNSHRLPVISAIKIGPFQIDENTYFLENSFYRGHARTLLEKNGQEYLRIDKNCRIRIDSDQIEISPQLYHTISSDRPRIRLRILGESTVSTPQLSICDHWQEGEIFFGGSPELCLAIRWRMQGKLRKVRMKNMANQLICFIIEHGVARRKVELNKSDIAYFSFKKEYREPVFAHDLRDSQGRIVINPDVGIDFQLTIQGYALDPYGFPLRHLKTHYGDKITTLSLDEEGSFHQTIALNQHDREFFTMRITGRRKLDHLIRLKFQPDFYRRIHSFLERDQQTRCHILTDANHIKCAKFMQKHIAEHSDIFLPISIFGTDFSLMDKEFQKYNYIIIGELSEVDHIPKREDALVENEFYSVYLRPKISQRADVTGEDRDFFLVKIRKVLDNSSNLDFLVNSRKFLQDFRRWYNPRRIFYEGFDTI
ncbi:MAG: hypothetical protein B6244_10200 [Candidatus Cloacimonetes bacterium 4572_55]|nr:MAG: hypothetical protein B6244_10200 [Candidatus Cloacimonetes bacterium 4572_55]